MAALGAIGHNLAWAPSNLAGPYAYWHNPTNRAVVHKNHDSGGYIPGVAGYANGRVPAVLVTTIVADFGQSGGGVSIF